MCHDGLRLIFDKNYQIGSPKLIFTYENYSKQARKGFRPPSAMKGIGYFQNLRKILRIFLEIFWIFWGIFWEFFRRIFWEEFFGRNFLGEIFWEDFFGGLFSREVGVYLEEWVMGLNPGGRNLVV